MPFQILMQNKEKRFMFIRKNPVLKDTILQRLQLQLFVSEGSPRVDELPDKWSSWRGLGIVQPCDKRFCSISAMFTLPPFKLPEHGRLFPNGMALTAGDYYLSKHLDFSLFPEVKNKGWAQHHHSQPAQRDFPFLLWHKVLRAPEKKPG